MNFFVISERRHNRWYKLGKKRNSYLYNKTCDNSAEIIKNLNSGTVFTFTLLLVKIKIVLFYDVSPVLERFARGVYNGEANETGRPGLVSMILIDSELNSSGYRLKKTSQVQGCA